MRSSVLLLLFENDAGSETIGPCGLPDLDAAGVLPFFFDLRPVPETVTSGLEDDDERVADPPIATPEAGPKTGLVSIRFSIARRLLWCTPGLLSVLLSDVTALGPRTIDEDTAGEKPFLGVGAFCVAKAC